MKQKSLYWFLTGPTAVGKTKLSIALAKAIGGEIISADSMQVYRSIWISARQRSRNGRNAGRAPLPGRCT